jgi:hypothetical protein
MILRAKRFFEKQFFVIFVLSISAILRWILIFKGGQFYFPDESRYGIAQDAMALLLDGKIKTALLALVGELAHVGFKATALIPALLETVFHTSLVLPAVFFSFFSILSLWLVWMVALKAGAPGGVANDALLIAACSQALLYYSRHLFPYDEAMFFGLLGLYVALEKDPSPRTTFLVGTLSFLCLVTYNGYWPLAAFPLLVHTLHGEKEKGWLLKRPALLGLGFLTPLVLLLLFCVAIGKDFFSDYGIYLQKIVQGSFGEGWSLPFEYFWHAEHGFILLVGLLSLVACFLFLKEGNPFLYLALGGTLFLYLCLVIPSNLTHTFVVYARTARQLMPFLALAAAYGLSYLRAWKPGGRWLANGVLAVVIVQAAWNYASVYKISYPREFVEQIQAQYPDFRVSDNMMRFYAPLVCRSDGLIVRNFHYIYTWPQALPPVQGDILMERAHPINFQPYQYDGFPPAARQAIRNETFKMVLYKPDPNDFARFKKEIEPCYQANKD